MNEGRWSCEKNMTQDSHQGREETENSLSSIQSKRVGSWRGELFIQSEVRELAGVSWATETECQGTQKGPHHSPPSSFPCR